VVAVVFIKTAACIQGWALLILERTFLRVIIENGLYSRAGFDRGNTARDMISCIR